MGVAKAREMFSLIQKLFQKLAFCSVGGRSGMVGDLKITDPDICENAGGISTPKKMTDDGKTQLPSSFWLPRSRYPVQGTKYVKNPDSGIMELNPTLVYH